MVLLAQLYLYTLFLDYLDEDAVRVGLVDFDENDWPD